MMWSCTGLSNMPVCMKPTQKPHYEHIFKNPFVFTKIGLFFPCNWKNWLEDSGFLSNNNHLTHSNDLHLNHYGHPPQTKPFRATQLVALFQQLVCPRAHVSAGFPIKFWLHRDEYLPPRALWQTAAFDCVWFSRLTSIPFEAWTNRNNGLWWPDQRPCSKTSPYGACPRCGSLRLAQFATGFHFNNGPWTRGLGVKSFNPRLEKITKSVFASWYCCTTFFAAEAEREEFILMLWKWKTWSHQTPTCSSVSCGGFKGSVHQKKKKNNPLLLLLQTSQVYVNSAFQQWQCRML